MLSKVSYRGLRQPLLISVAIAMLLVVLGSGAQARTPVKEIVDERTMFSKNTLNDDGSVTIDFSTLPIFYEDESGALQPVDTSVTPVAGDAEYAFGSTRNPLKTLFPRSPKGKIRLEARDKWVTMELPDAKMGKTEASGNTMVYSGVWIDSDVRYTVMSGLLKEDIILRSPQAPNVFQVRLHHPELEVTVNEDGSISLEDRSGTPVMVLPAPYAHDSSTEPIACGLSYDVSETHGSITTLSVTVDREWMNRSDITYPIVVDPTVSVYYSSNGALGGGYQEKLFYIGYAHYIDWQCTVTGYSEWWGSWQADFWIYRPDGSVAIWKYQRGSGSYTYSGSLLANQFGNWKVKVGTSGKWAWASGSVTYNHTDTSAPTFTSRSQSGARRVSGDDLWVRPGDVVNIRHKGTDDASGMQYHYLRTTSPTGDEARIQASHNNEFDTSPDIDLNGGGAPTVTAGAFGWSQTTCEVEYHVKVLSPADRDWDVWGYYADMLGNNSGSYFDLGYNIRVDGTGPSNSASPPSCDWSDTASTRMTVTDSRSGIASLEYAWSLSQSTPTSGWVSVPVSGYPSSKYVDVQKSDSGTWYVHARSTDAVGNTTTTCLGPFGVSGPAEPTSLSSTISGGQVIWSWVPSSNGLPMPSGYEVKIGTTDGSDDIIPAHRIGNTTSYRHGALPGVYYLSVRSYSSTGKVSGWTSNRVTIGDQLLARYTYNMLGQVTRFEDSRGQITEYSNGLFGVTEERFKKQDGSQSQLSNYRYEYDGLGNVTKKLWQTAPGSVTFDRWTTTEYDQVGRPIRVTYSFSSSQVRYQYDVANNVKKAYYDYAGDGPYYVYTDYGYTARSFLDYYTQNVNGRSYTVDYQASSAGAVTQIAYPFSGAVDYDRDLMGRITKVRSGSTYYAGGPSLSGFEYRDTGFLSKVNYVNGITEEFIPDPRNRVDQIKLYPRSTPSSLMMSLDYTLDGEGNVKQINSDTFRYDKLNRLTVSTVDGQTSIYGMDLTGNRTMIKDAAGVRDYTVVDHNILTQAGSTSYSYDVVGNQVAKAGASGQYAYTYDEENRLIRVTRGSTTITEYWYDAGGSRVRSVENGQTIYYVYDGLNVIQEDNITSGIRTDYIYAGSTRIVEKQGSTVRYYHGDHLGSTRVATDAAGAKVADYKYAPYGSTISHTGTFSTDYKFTGKPEDSVTGLYYFGARYYDPELGRFITQDLARDGVNWYEYCRSNPLRYIDPDGRRIELETGASWTQQAAYDRAIAYLQQSRTASRLLERVDGGARESVVIVFIDDELRSKRPDVDTSYVVETRWFGLLTTRTIYWDPYQGLRVGSSGEVQSPALGLVHELGHFARDLDGETIEGEIYRLWDEEENLRKYETPVASELGEPRRAFYRDVSSEDPAPLTSTTPLPRGVTAVILM